MSTTEFAVQTEDERREIVEMARDFAQTEIAPTAAERDRTKAPPVVFSAAYGDYRETDGLLMAHAEENYASGRHTASTPHSPLDPPRLTRVRQSRTLMI